MHKLAHDKAEEAERRIREQRQKGEEAKERQREAMEAAATQRRDLEEKIRREQEHSRYQLNELEKQLREKLVFPLIVQLSEIRMFEHAFDRQRSRRFKKDCVT